MTKCFKIRLRKDKLWVQCFTLILAMGFISSYGKANQYEIEVIDVNRVLKNYQPLPKMVYPLNNQWSQDKEDLGKMLFFDPRLSGKNNMSCSTCHKPERGFTDGLPRGIGKNKKELGRNTISIINSGYIKKLMWDGRFKNLEDQALIPMILNDEMNQNLDQLIEELEAVPGYARKFREVFGGDGITQTNIAKALATFERSIVSSNAPYDRFREGNKSAMSESAIRGMNLFFGRAECSFCHKGPNFTDNRFHHLGVKQHGPLKDDFGRFNVTNQKLEKQAFRTPSLRQVTQSAPYMHDGSLPTLKSVIEFYSRGGDEAGNSRKFIKPLNLNNQNKKDLIEFLIALEGEPIKILPPVLP